MNQRMPQRERARLLFILGTRPEAIKLAPLIRRFQAIPDEFETRVCVTAQHRQMLDQVMHALEIRADDDLNVMTPGQSLSQVTARMMSLLEPVFASAEPDLTFVQGDTTTTLCGALAAYYHRVPVAHVEAGLRTGDLRQPFPEEGNRLLTGRLAELHFAPTDWARQNLLAEGVPAESVFVTGNTGIDSLLHMRDRLAAGEETPPQTVTIEPGRRLILVTTHRRENFGAPLGEILRALAQLAARPDVAIALPVHPNPQVQGAVESALRPVPHVHLLPPLDYVSFVSLMCRAEILITDSGGVQEEGPSLGKPILVLREKTERPEAVTAGVVRLVGTDASRIVSEAALLLDDRAGYQARARIANPYGDGLASERIVEHVRQWRASRTELA